MIQNDLANIDEEQLETSIGIKRTMSLRGNVACQTNSNYIEREKEKDYLTTSAQSDGDLGGRRHFLFSVRLSPFFLLSVESNGFKKELQNPREGQEGRNQRSSRCKFSRKTLEIRKRMRRNQGDGVHLIAPKGGGRSASVQRIGAPIRGEEGKRR